MSFEDKLEQFYGGLQLTGTVIIDVGANVGRHTIPLAKKTGPSGCVFAFEPIPLMRSQLTQSLGTAGINNVVIFPFALGATRHLAEFNYVPNLPEESGLRQRHAYNGVPDEFQKIPVGVFCLDQLIPLAQKVSFIKIDVEGGELDVLKGARRVLTTSRPIVAFECGAASFLGYHEKPDEIFEIFASSRYVVYSIIGTKMESAAAFSEAAFAQNFWDYIALPVEQSSHSVLLTNTPA